MNDPRSSEHWFVAYTEQHIILSAPDGRQVRADRIPIAEMECEPGRLDRLTADIPSGQPTWVEGVLHATRERVAGTFWRSGRIPTGDIALVTLPRQQPIPVRNGKPGYRRSRFTVTMTVGDRSYSFRHRSKMRADIHRDGVHIATAVRTKRFGNLISRGNELTHLMHPVTALDLLDESVAILFAEAFGPPGRRGVLGNLLSNMTP